jgi:Tfp pilus assembly protein PilO
MSVQERLVEMTFSKVFLIGVAFAVLYYFVGYDSGIQHINRASQDRLKIQQLSVEIEAVQTELNRSREFKETLRLKDEQFLTFTSYIPERLNVSDMMKAISSEAKAAGVNILSIKDAKPTTANYQFTAPLAVDVELEGGFPQHILFLSYLTRLDSIFTLDAMSFQGESQTSKGQDPKDVSVKFKATIVGYRYVGNQPEESKKGKKK